MLPMAIVLREETLSSLNTPKSAKEPGPMVSDSTAAQSVSRNLRLVSFFAGHVCFTSVKLSLPISTDLSVGTLVITSCATCPKQSLPTRRNTSFENWFRLTQ